MHSNRLSLIILVSSLVLYTFLTFNFLFVCDDAFISFRYSKNWALGHGLRYNLGEHIPVEGYSNFLWVILGGLILKLGLAIEFWVPLVSYACGVTFLIQIFKTLQKHFKIEPLTAALATCSLALFPPFFVWSTSGMATMPLALLIFLTFKELILDKRAIRAGIFALLLGLIRAEGFAWVGFIGVIATLNHILHKDNSFKKILIYFLIFAVGYGAYFLWRYNYYGELFPNTVTNKVGFNSVIAERGVKYSLVYYLTFLTPILSLFGLIFSLKYKQYFLPLFLITGATFTYPIVVGGDFMTMGRFFAPTFAFQTILIAVMLKNFNRLKVPVIIALITIHLIPAFDYHVVSSNVREKFHFRLNTSKYRSEAEQWAFMKSNSERWQHLGRGLKSISQPGDSLVAGAIGNLGYFSELYIYDRFGLVETRVAKREVRKMKNKSPGHDKAVPSTFFLADKPTYLKAYILMDPKMDKVNRRIESWKKRKDYQGYEPVYYDLHKQNSKGEKLALLVLKRKDI